MRRLATALTAVALATGTAAADHGGALRAEGWSPMAAALIFGGLALLAGMLVVVIVALLARRGRPSP
ncbi:MAG TPA: hypothetical protein VGR82_10535 [Methylomirabilota bacterium]|jgi:hypothetical protein|nr:hypothetical protein [Methylomirabilota bacterium]